ncbi:hypothetical protein L2E82_25329 [Cichorium intybus]|uniref:Uncharacterized protein n=1 Tax=Cichorium intybus TaxID=13427 RepID=A0ACB9E3L6_CICIN|nr:hypothetical protein L2E82_25329 [Cichorium intybus]
MFNWLLLGIQRHDDGLLYTYSSNDDDFVKMPPVKVSKLKILGKKTLRAKPEKRQDSLRLLNTRFPPEHITKTIPEHITKTMALLNNDPRACVKSIGFGKALTMQLTKLPRRICYWVVNNYDPNTNYIHIKDQTLKIKRDIVHQIYGIPMGDIRMSNPSKSNPENHVVKLWKSQFPKTLKRIRLTNVVDMIQNDTTGGPFFVLNFLVLFVSVMIECPTMGTINQGFLENLGDVLDIKQLDRCGFVISSLKSSRTMWKSLDDNCVFTGPIVFLLLFYIHFTNVEDRPIQNSTVGLINWTSKMLKDRQLQELSKGGFGNVTISSQHMDMSHCEREDGEDVDDTTSMRDCPFSEGFTENVVQQILGKRRRQQLDRVLDAEAFDIIEKVALAACSKNSKQQSLSPDHRGSHLIIHAGNADPVTVVAPRRADMDLVFESNFGDLGHRGIFESMIPGSKIHATIIDIWASILNHQERHRNKKSPARMFSSREESDEVKYRNIPYDLKILFTLYVDELNHKKANRIKHAKPMSGCMEWTTKYNNIDCGVFLMRHMETYKDEDLDKWDIGFQTEYKDNDDQ